jgi:hypothetical protein
MKEMEELFHIQSVKAGLPNLKLTTKKSHNKCLFLDLKNPIVFPQVKPLLKSPPNNCYLLSDVLCAVLFLLKYV